MDTNFYRYYFDNRVCVAVNSKNENMFTLGFSFRNPNDKHDKRLAKNIADGRLNKAPILLNKDFVREGSSIFNALKNVVREKYEHHKLQQIKQYQAISQQNKEKLSSEFATKAVRKELSFPYWLIKILTK